MSKSYSVNLTIFDCAEELAKTSNHYKTRLASVILNKKGRIISSGVNTIKTHPFQAKMSNMAGNGKCCQQHAEISSIIQCKDISEAYEMYVLRILRDGTRAMAKPCKICDFAIKNFTNIKRVFYTENSTSIGVKQYGN